MNTTPPSPSTEPLLTLQDILRLFAETDRQIQETSRSIRELIEESKETDRQIQETSRSIRELREESKETDRRFQETDLKFQETARQFKATDRRLNKLENLFTSQWGRLMESLVEGDLVPLLQARGIAVGDTTTRLKGQIKGGGNYEFDILAHNGDEMVVVEVKTTLRPQDVNRFTDKLRQMKQWLPRYANQTIYGAMAWLQADAGAEEMAKNQGLWSIRATGSSAAIVNEADFQPRAW